MLTTVSIVEDQPRTLSALAQLVDGWPNLQCLKQYPTAEAAIDDIRVAKTKPDILLVDMELPGLSGVECIRILKALQPEMVFLVYSRHDQAEWLFPALHAGAAGYLLKDSPASELLDGILAAARKEAPMSSQIARKALDYFRSIDAEATDGSSQPLNQLPAGQSLAAKIKPVLTESEAEILRLLAAGLVNKQVADQLKISPRTLSHRLEQIRAKLHAPNQTAAIVTYLSGHTK